MYSKIIFVLATVCVVNASVITVNVFDDDAETEVKVSPIRCNSKVCNWLCHGFKKTSGKCVNGHCKCEKSLIAKDAVTETNVEEDSVQSRACNNNRCNQICRKQKFRGGACVGANCYCNKFLSLQDDTLTDSVENLSLLSCNSIACDDQCRRTGWHSGICINGQCKCDYFVNTKGDAFSENSFFNVQNSVSPKRCTVEACNALCRKLQLGEGVCISSRCRCSNYKPTPNVVMADLDESSPIDDNFLSDNFLSTEDEVSENSLPVSDLSEDETERSCNVQACDQLCRRLKFRGGVCVNGRCKCDNFLGTGVDAVDEYLEQATRRACHVRKCNRTCTRRGYAGARCVNGQCQCYDKIERKADMSTSLQNDVTRDENVETNEIPRTNEEDPIEVAPSACNTAFCNEMCHRLKYAGGWCRFGQCQCY